MDTGTLNFIWSRHLVACLQAAGVTHAVASPGSRSTPLMLALLRQPGLRLEIVLDERSAAFFALGVAKASRRPVILVATSGTAIANWLPAVIEASQSAIPLILISADRPPELQACGANQTIEQSGLFGHHVRAGHVLPPPHENFDSAWLQHLMTQVVEQATWPHPGPVHINQAFREPLVPQGDIDTLPSLSGMTIRHGTMLPDQESIVELAQLIGGRRGVIVCGELPETPGLADALAALARQLDCPILAEPLSGLRFGRHDRGRVLTHYNRWLDDHLLTSEYSPEWVLRFGAFPVSRQLQRYIAKAPIQILVDPYPGQRDPSHRLSHLLRAEPLAICESMLRLRPLASPSGWHRAFAEFDKEIPEPGNAWHISILLAEIPDESALFIGNSLAIRQFDTHSGCPGRVFYCYGNRGVSGIDGNVSTALGLAEIHGRVIALLGDLSCQHDLGGLALAADRDAVFIVVNNGGGGIFDHLPQATLPEFERGWRTPQNIDFSHAAASFQVGYHRACNATVFRQVLQQALAAGGPQLIELITE